MESLEVMNLEGFGIATEHLALCWCSFGIRGGCPQGKTWKPQGVGRMAKWSDAPD